MSLSTQRNSLPALCFTWKQRLTESTWLEFYRDDFDNGFLSADWTENQTDAGRTIVETGDVLTIEIDEGTSGSWSSAGGAGYNRAPKAYMELGPDITLPCEIITKITDFTTNDDDSNIGGLIIGTYPTRCYGKFRSGNNEPGIGVMMYYPDGDIGNLRGIVVTGGAWATNNAFGYLWFESVGTGPARWKNNTWIDDGGNNFLIAEDDATHDNTYMFGITDYGIGRHLMVRRNSVVFDRDADGTIPVWLKIAIDASWEITFWYSTDGVNYTQYEHTAAPFSVNASTLWGWDGGSPNLKVGLYAMNSESGTGATAVSFEYFIINRMGEVGEWATSQDCVSFIDARAPEVFYSGRVKSMSSLKRAIDDKTGLYKIADMSVVLANNDRKYSRLATSGILKNQEATLVHIWTDQSEAAKLDVIDLVVEDQSLKGKDFHVKLKDITQKYFSKKIPGSICTEADYPNIHPDHVGRYMPEVLGHNVIGTAYEKPGAVEAVYINTAGAPYQYLASRGQLHSVLDVYSDGALLGVGDWAFVAGPPSLINITPDQGDNKITFDANGYITAGWNSANGYIQSLPYIIEYLLETLMEMPATKVDSAAFDALATYFEDQGWDEDGFLILQKQQDAMETLRQLLFTAGIKGYVALGGNFTGGIKDWFNYEIDSLDAHVFSQLELLGPPERQWNLPKAINTIKARYGYIPWQQLWFGATEEYKENYYDAIMEDDVPIHWKDRPPPV